ncbi:serine/threonine protein kinase [Salinibaculum salinum]|uniref:serine/threonine protein kinase n=1 Tax=Salinibaculum salinum TaxID=3131996 RepID=UPI0030EC76A2
MSSSDPDELAESLSVLVSVLDDPEQGKKRLPRIVSLFESDHRRVRLSAAWACLAVANELEDEDTIEYLVRRLSDRLDEEHVSLELTTTLDYISTRYSGQVERILEQMDHEEREQGSVPLPRVGNFTRSNYYSSDHSRDGVGRMQVAGAESETGPRHAYAASQRDERDQAERERDRGESDGNEEADDADGNGGPSAGDERENAFGAMGQERTEVASIATGSRFDKLHILAARQRGRYADIYDALVGNGSEEEAVALRLFHDPADTSDQFDYVARMETQLSRWEAVSGHDHIVTALDWSVDPKPWLATLFAGESLAEFGHVPPERVLDDAINLADAVSHLHGNGVVHAGIDPGNVAYPGALVEGEGQRPPLLDNVGLMRVFRLHFDPALHLDPRYAAPEYFDSQYGGIDHSTDIYQLGAVLYHLCTGKPPYTGQFDQVRESVLNERPAPPSTVAEGVPPAVDDVITKAMAQQKLTRYETVEHLQQELVGIRRRDEDG